MVAARELLYRFNAEFEVVDETKGTRRRWPYVLELASDTAPLWACICSECVALRPDRLPVTDEDWQFR